MQICGHVPGAIGRIVELHGRYYAREWRFGRYFEAKIASELGELFARFDASRDGFWIAAEGEEGVSGRPKQQRVDHARIALGERIERVWQGEDDMKVGNGEQFCTPGLDPAGTGLGLTRGAVPISTRVEGETCGAAVVTRLPTPAQRCGTPRSRAAPGSERLRADACGDRCRHGHVRGPRG